MFARKTPNKRPEPMAVLRTAGAHHKTFGKR